MTADSPAELVTDETVQTTDAAISTGASRLDEEGAYLDGRTEHAKKFSFIVMADFLTQCQRAMRYRRLSYLTELSYLGWIKNPDSGPVTSNQLFKKKTSW